MRNAFTAACMVALVAVGWCIHERVNAYALDERAKIAEAHALEADDLALLYDAELAERDALVEQLTKESASFKEAYEKAKRAAHVKVIEVVRTSTGPSLVGGAPPTTVIDTTEPCVLRKNDKGTVWVREATLETSNGNRILVGSAEAWRVSPEPAVRLFEGPFQAQLTEAKSAPLPAQGFETWQLVLIGVGIAVVSASAGVLIGR
jgi:hypothetical protein